MKTYNLTGTRRTELGKKASKQVRKNESFPCVMYGEGEPIHFLANVKEYSHVVYTPHVYLINLDIDGTVYPSVIQDIQFHPVSDAILHMDLLRVNLGKPVSVSIPVRLEGFAAGVQQGGKLKLEMKRVKVRGLVESIPDQLVLDVTPLELGQTIKVRDLSYPEFTILDPKNSVIASVRVTRVAKAPTASEEETAKSAPESPEVSGQ